MKLIVTDDDGVVLDTLENITREEWDDAQRRAITAHSLIGSLCIADDDAPGLYEQTPGQAEAARRFVETGE